MALSPPNNNFSTLQAAKTLPPTENKYKTILSFNYSNYNFFLN